MARKSRRAKEGPLAGVRIVELATVVMAQWRRRSWATWEPT